MSDPAERPAGALPLAGAAYAFLCSLHLVLALSVSGTAPADPLLPLWMRLSLLAAEFGLLGLGVALLAPGFALLGALHRGAPLPLKLLTGMFRSTLAAGLLAALGASWAVFALGGQFLDGAGLLYGAANAGAIARHAASLHPGLLFGLPVLALALGALACEVFPRVWASGPLLFRRAGLALSGVLLCAGLFFGAGGAWISRGYAEKRLDDAQGITYSGSELYALGWQRRAGPLSHLAARALRGEDLLDREPVADLPERRRPQIPLEQWAASADASRARPWNVVLVLVDSLRPDQLRAWGDVREVMPALNGLGTDARIFLDCTTPASHTDYAVPSLFASHSPLRSKDVYRYPRHPAYPRVLLHDLFKARGYRTALFSSQNEDWGQMREYLQTPGLDLLEDARSLGDAGERAGVAWTIDDAVTMDAALRWIPSKPAPFFAALNLQNPHLPYRVPEAFPRRFGAGTPAIAITAAGFPREQADAARALYADSLAYADSQIARLIAHLKSSGCWDETILVVSADHGEAFFEHGLAAHANGVFEEVVKVPLFIRAPGLVPGLESRPAELLDVAPTLLGLLGLPPHPSHQGRDLLGLDPVAEPRSRHLISDTPWKTHLGILRGRHKLIFDGDAGRFALYDLAEDPGESRDVSGAQPELARELRSRLAAWRRAQLDYYSNPLRQASEYPPLLEDR